MLMNRILDSHIEHVYSLIKLTRNQTSIRRS